MHFLPFVHLETTGALCALCALCALGALEARFAKIPESPEILKNSTKSYLLKLAHSIKRDVAPTQQCLKALAGLQSTARAPKVGASVGAAVGFAVGLAVGALVKQWRSRWRSVQESAQWWAQESARRWAPSDRHLSL
jgi:hypothetical protein